MKQKYYHIDTSSILDLDAYGLIKRLRKIKIVIVPEVFKEIKDRGLKRRLKKMTMDLGPQKRAAFVPGLDALDYGESAIIRAKGKMAHDFRVFFMGHKGSMESKYTTNKGTLSEVLLQEMRDAFARSEEFLDLECTTAGRDPVLEQKQEMHHMIRKVTPEQLGLMLEALRTMQGAGNMAGPVHTLNN